MRRAVRIVSAAMNKKNSILKKFKKIKVKLFNLEKKHLNTLVNKALSSLLYYKKETVKNIPNLGKLWCKRRGKFLLLEDAWLQMPWKYTTSTKRQFFLREIKFQLQALPTHLQNSVLHIAMNYSLRRSNKSLKCYKTTT